MAEVQTIQDRETGDLYEGPVGTPFDPKRYALVEERRPPVDADAPPEFAPRQTGTLPVQVPTPPSAWDLFKQNPVAPIASAAYPIASAAYRQNLLILPSMEHLVGAIKETPVPWRAPNPPMIPEGQGASITPPLTPQQEGAATTLANVGTLGTVRTQAPYRGPMPGEGRFPQSWPLIGRQPPAVRTAPPGSTPGPMTLPKVEDLPIPPVVEPPALSPPRQLLAETKVQTGDQPTRVFHGSAKGFQEFDPAVSDPNALYGPGLYFTESPGVASGYAKQGGSPNVRPAYLDIRKPFDIDAPADPRLARQWLGGSESNQAAFQMPERIRTSGDLYNEMAAGIGKDATNQALQAAGYDGITHIGGGRTGGEPHRVWIAFKPEQVVSPFAVERLPAETLDAAVPPFSEPPPMMVEGPPSPKGAAMRLPEPGPPRPRIPVAGEPPGGLTHEILSLPVHKKVLTAAEELLTAGEVPRDPSMLLSDQVTTLLSSGRLSNETITKVLADHNTTYTELADGLFRPAIRDSARRLQTLSALSQRLDALGKTPGGAAEMEALREIAATMDAPGRLQSWWRRVDNVRRGLLVSQLSTAVRNAETQVVRGGLDSAQAAMDAGIQKVFGSGTATPVHAADAFGLWLNLARRGTKADTEAILGAFPKEHDRLFNVYASDIARRSQGGTGAVADRVFDKADRAVAVLNTANNFQEYAMRRAAFVAKLDQKLRGRGGSLEQAIAKPGDIPLEDIRGSIDHALEVTFSAQPKYGTVGQKFVSFVTSMPGATLLLPFPRFLVNSLKFQLDYSPVGLLKLVSKGEREKLASGNPEVLSRALLGTAMLGAAAQFRDSKYAGEKWYELQLQDGRTVDMRPYNPFASYLFVADIVKRKREGRLHTLTGRDVATGLLSTNLRAGTGLYALDQALGGLSEFGDSVKAADALKGFAGEAVGGFFTPLRQIDDFISAFSDQQQVLRSSRTEPFLGPIKRSIPGLNADLPPAASPTRRGPLVRESPLLRQALGIQINSAKNPLEHELDRLGFDRPTILPRTGHPDVDLSVAENMGRLSERVLVPFVTGPGYAKLSDPMKGEQVSLMLSAVRQAAFAQFIKAEPERYRQLYVERLSPRLRVLLRSLEPATP
jgi:hypothetical protein